MSFNQRKINEIRKQCYKVLSNPKLENMYHNLAKEVLKDMNELEEINKENLQRTYRRKNGLTNMGYNQDKKVVGVKDGEVVKSYDSIRYAEYDGYFSGNVSACCKNHFNREGNRKYKGIDWYYQEEWENIQKNNPN